jgi:hypothetical protein
VGDAVAYAGAIDREWGAVVEVERLTGEHRFAADRARLTDRCRQQNGSSGLMCFAVATAMC